MQSSINEGRLRFLTYNRALATNVKQPLTSLGAARDVDVSTYHEWAREVAQQLGLSIKKWAVDKDRQAILPEILRALRANWGAHRLLSADDGFWQAEFEWLSGRGFVQEGEYVSATRVGRQQRRRRRAAARLAGLRGVSASAHREGPLGRRRSGGAGTGGAQPVGRRHP